MPIEHPPIGHPYVLGFDMDDRAFPIIARSVDPREDGYSGALPALFSAAPEPWCASNLFVEIRPTQSDQRVLWIYRILPGPIIQSSTWDQENRCEILTFWRSARYDATPPAVGSTYSTASVLRHNAIASLANTDPGSNYISIPTISIEVSEGGGPNATATVTSLKVVSATISSLGANYTLGNTLTVPGGTFTTAATLTVSTVGLATIALSAVGSGYFTGDLVTLEGGVYSEAATVRITGTVLNTILVNAPGTGMAPGGIGVGTTLTLVNAASVSNTPATVNVATTKVVSATVATAGTGGTPGTQTVTGTTGTGTKFTASVTINGGGGIAAVLSILTGGNYTVNPASLTNAPVSGPGPLTGAELNIVMGALTVVSTQNAVFTTETLTFTSTGGGGDATFNTAVYGAVFAEIASPGAYTTASATYTQQSTSGSGSGATFDTPSYTIVGLTIANGGAYTVIPTSPVSPTGGSGSAMQAVLNFGIGTVSAVSANAGYYSDFPTVTLSYGNGQVTAIMDALAVVPGLTGYVRRHAMEDTENEFIKRMVWEVSAKPPNRKSNPHFEYEFPALFRLLATTWPTTPWPGIHYELIAHRRATYPALETILFGLAPSTNLPPVFQMVTPANGSRMFPIHANTAHGALFWGLTEDGVRLYEERFAASTPYRPGDILIVLVEQELVFGCFWRGRIVRVCETNPIY